MRVQLYEWLRGDGSSYIDTEISIKDGDSIESDVLIDIADDGRLIGSTIRASKNGSLAVLMRVTQGQAQLFVLPSRNIISGLTMNSEVHCEVSINDGYCYLNTLGQEVSLPYQPNGNWVLMNIDTDIIERNSFKGKVKCFIIKQGTNTFILKPCKLLSPYNNHPAGECAMIDVLSNTLYFNQGTGSFSVEGEAGEIIDTTPVINNIISKESTKAVRLREWLVSNKGGQQINVNIPLNSTTPIKARVMLNMSEQYPHNGRHFLRLDGYNFAFYGNGVAGSPIRLSVWSVYSQYDKSYDAKNGATEVEIYSDRIITEFGNYTINASEITYILQQHIDDEQCKECIVGEIIGDNIHLYPAELALPYGNHPIGECCMIDLLSGQLYFNQGSGSFTCEGAILDYWQDKPMVNHYCDVEGTLHKSVQIFADNGKRLALIWEKSKPWSEHRWLVANVPTGCTMLTLQVNDTLRYKRLWKQVGNVGYVRNDNFAFYSANNDKLNTVSIWNIKTQSSGISYLIDDGVIDVSINPKNYKIGTFESQDYIGDNILFVIGNNANGQREAIFNTSTITIDGHILTPAILDRPTLASEDNNNIARKQSEAVFVDEQRYRRGLPWVFGNVASSGSFSVSDYLIENQDFERISGVTNGDYTEGYSPWIDLNYIPKSTDTIRIDYLVKDTGVNINGARVLTTNVVQTWGSISAFVNNEPKYIMYGWYSGYTIRDFFNKRISSVISNSGIWYNDTKINISEEPNFDLKGLRIGRDFGSRTSSPFVLFSLKVEGVIDLIPVRLLRTIEPTCTHNGKGGKANEIGFFDTISGKFYGNDGSGEFTEYVP